MAYGEKYTFRFDSQEGKAWMVVIFEEGYTGTPVSRCVGGHPLLRMESNGCIRGMSLELPAECVVADEYADLYTSDPVRFKVSVYLDHDEVWQGFITPELYSAPWVDPPHDVALTATDGLGELKRQNYARGGRMSLATHLGNLLAATGLTLPIRMVSSLESDVNEPEDFLTGTLINLDHLSGETMYDALQAILASIHATVRQSGGSWLLIRETDISGSSAGSEVDDTEGAPIPVVPFGSMRTSDVWPVGRLTSEIVPARNSVTVTSDNESDREFLDDPDMTEGSWDGDATHSSDDGGYYQMAVGESISQEVTMPEMPSTTVEVPDMRLKVTARQADTAKAHNIRIKVSSYMHLAVSDRHETYWLSENSSGELVWTDVDGYLDREIPAAAVSRSTDCTSIEIIIPVTRHSQREERKIPETVTVEFASDDNTVYVHAASLGIIPQWAGIETRVTIDNGARGGDSPVGVMFADSEAYNRGLTWMSNCAYGLGTDIVPIHTLASGSITAAGTGVFLAQDYAMSVANPRLSLKGVLQIPSGAPIPVFLSTDGVVFIAEEWSYDLLTDELDVSMLSLPAVEIEVEDVTQESYSEKGGGGERASASSGGSAPSTPQARTLDWFIAETYTEDNTTKQRLRLNPKYQGMYADGWVSAGGIGTGGGGTIVASLPDLTDVNDNLYTGLQTGQALVWDGTKWTGGTVSGNVDPATVSTYGTVKVAAVESGTATNVRTGVYGNRHGVKMDASGKTYVDINVQASTSLFGGFILSAAQRNVPASSFVIGGTTSGRYYGVEMNNAGQLFVNVPWDSAPASSVSSVAGYTGDVTAAQLSTALGLSGYLPLTAGSSKPLTGPLNIKLPGSENTYYDYLLFRNSDNTEVASMRVTGIGHIGLYATQSIEFMAGNTRRFTVSGTYGLYPEMNGTITLTSAGAFSSLGDGYDIGRRNTSTTSTSNSRFIRAVRSRIYYLTDDVYIYYDTVNNCIRTNAPIVSDSYISAGGVSST